MATDCTEKYGKEYTRLRKLTTDLEIRQTSVSKFYEILISDIIK